MGKGGIHFRDARGPDGMALYAVGDVHGRLDLLKSMFAAIAADRDSRKPRDWRIILLGDYVDRGPDSRGVIDFIIKAQEQGDGRIVPLAGNHDVGFLEFLAEGDLEAVISGIRKQFGKGRMPRTVNLISGPSRSGDIEQKLVLGAHGPRALHLIVVGG